MANCQQCAELLFTCQRRSLKIDIEWEEKPAAEKNLIIFFFNTFYDLFY